MRAEIDYEENFFSKLESGINVFAGAGFSVLEDTEGNKLPDAKELASEVCAKFGVTTTLANDLELVSMNARNKSAKGFDSYLREKFRVKGINPLYEVLNRINIITFITTNIDNLYPTILEKDEEAYLNSVAKNGMGKKIGKEVDYIALHGDITDIDSFLYFGAFEISMAAANNKKLFTVMQAEMYKRPTLFWGYGFHDSSVMNSIGAIMIENAHNIWIVFRRGDEDKAITFRNLGFNVIISNTDELLETIGTRFSRKMNLSHGGDKYKAVWKPYEIPSLNQQKLHIDAADYFREGTWAWNVIFSRYPYETNWVREVCERLRKNKTLVILGTPQSGKTTLITQAAISIDGPCYYLSELTEEHAQKLSVSTDADITVFFDDCSDDMEAFATLARNPKIRLIGITDEYGYESSKHILADIDYSVYAIPDLDESEANMVYEHIADPIRNATFTYSKKENEKYSFLEFCLDNIRDVISVDKVYRFLKTIDDPVIREILFLTAHLSSNGSFLSTNVLWAYIQPASYDAINEIINKANEALSSIDEKIDPDLRDQDYYVLRSNTFGKYLVEVASEYYRDEYKKVISKLIDRVPRGIITRYYIYRRTAYDAGMFYKIFGNEADQLYDDIYSYDDSAYTLQQKALYYSRNHRFSEAFNLIDKANQKLPNNFSIKNTKAIITFEANRHSRDPEAKHQLDNAMEILAKCYESDKRKVYHAQKFAEYAIFIYKEFQDNRYIKTASDWLDAISSDGSASHKTKDLKRRIKEEMI